MTIPPLSLGQALAIGLPLGIAGLALQEVILGRRRPGGGTAATTPPPAPVSTPARQPAVYPWPPPGSRASPWLPGESDLRQLADAVGVELTAELLSVRKEISPGG
jgi:hypothetical protein